MHMHVRVISPHVYAIWPRRQQDDTYVPPALAGLGTRASAALGWLYALLARADRAGCGLYVRAVLATCAINPMSALLLSGMGLNQLLLAPRYSQALRLAVPELDLAAL